MLLVEVGNSTIKTARPLDGGGFRVERHADDDSAVAAINAAGLPALLAPVAGPRAASLEGLDVPVMAITHDTIRAFVADTYDTPDTLGIDRVLNVIGLDVPGIVISCGTAITVDALGNDGPVWGAILPGFTTAAEGLHARIPTLPLVEIDEAIELPARTSRQSVVNGVVLGTALAARELASRHSRIVFGSGRVPVTITGGDARLLRRLWTGELYPHIDEDLLFRAMMRVGGA